MTDDLALLIIRCTVAYVFLYAAWRNTENTNAWTWTKNETAVLFANLPEPQRLSTAARAALVGMVLMYGGGLSVLLGLEARVGGLALAIFSILGMRIHAIRRDEALAAGQGGNAMGWSAYSGHIAAGLKNVALMGAGLLIALMGSGRWSVSDYVGRWLNLS
jgi:uncharacterized membrane protein YphA (DoxX/SURF4 family)